MPALALAPQEVVVDDRGHALRSTWHSGERVLVLSTWHDGICVSSVRLTPPEVARLGGCLMAALADASNERATPVVPLRTRITRAFRRS